MNFEEVNISRIQRSIQLLFTAPPPGESALQELLAHVLSKHDFTTDRGLSEYTKAFGQRFKEQMNRNSSGMRWIDAGAGQVRAMQDYLRSRSVKSSHRPAGKLTAVTLQVVGEDLRGLRRQGIKVLVGRKFEDVSLSEIGPVSTITDYTGVLNYTAHIDVVLRKYIQLLEPAGMVFVCLPLFLTFIRRRDGQILNIIDWISSIDGLRVGKLPSKQVFWFQAKKRNISVPRLVLRSAVYDHFFYRLYSETEESCLVTRGSC
jgi:hypothetical protein